MERRLKDIQTEEIIQELRLRGVREVEIKPEEVYQLRAWGASDGSKERFIKGSGTATILEIKR